MGDDVGITQWRAFEAAPEDWFDRDEVDKARRYVRPIRVVGMADRIASFVAVVTLVASGAVASLVDGRPWALGVILAISAVTLVEVVVSLPASAWRDLSYDKRWGFSTTTTWRFAGDAVKGVAIGAVLNAALFLPVWALIRSTPNWWLWAAVVFAAVNVLFAVVLPVAIAPLFNTFTPLADGPLRDRLFEVVRAVDADVQEILVEDASKRDTRKNAYVAGLGKTRRVVVYDTMLEWPDEEIANVVAHELGHWKLRHIRGMIPALVVMSFVIFAAMKVALEQRFILDLADVTSLGDPAAVPLFLVVFPLVSSVASLGLTYLVRAHEREADLFALAALRAPTVYASMMRRLHTEALADLTPSRWRRFRMSHPPAAERMAMAVEWGRRAGLVSGRGTAAVASAPPGASAPVFPG